MIVEITTYKPADGVSEDQIKAASKLFDKNYCSRCNGLISRNFLKTSDGFMDIFYWESLADVEHVQATFMDDEDAVAFGKLLDTTSFTMNNYELIEEFRPTR